MLCHQHLDSVDVKGLKHKLDVNLKTSCLHHTDPPPRGVPIVFCKRVPKRQPWLGTMLPQCALLLSLNFHYITKGRPQGLRTVLLGQSHCYFFGQLKKGLKVKNKQDQGSTNLVYPVLRFTEALIARSSCVSLQLLHSLLLFPTFLTDSPLENFLLNL